MGLAPALFALALAEVLALAQSSGLRSPVAPTQDEDACLAAEGAAALAQSEVEVEQAEEAETAMMEVQLLQTKVQTRPMPIGPSGPSSVTVPLDSAPSSEDGPPPAHDGSVAKAPEASPADPGPPDGIVSLDHNGRVCMLCGRPLPERLGGKSYTRFRRDCGGRSSPTGPTAADLTVPAVQFARPGVGAEPPMNGFCALNFAKSCADAVANEDYLYWPKSLDLASESMSANAPWDARYCSLNGFLERDILALQHNFTGMQAKAHELCSMKYAKHGIDKLTFLDMMSKSRYDDKNAPTLEEAELLAAWNCAMGDLGCDMAMCAYSFCRKGRGSFGLYGECAGWDPVTGMPL